MEYEEWIKSVPKEITNDPLWKLEVYRLSMFLSELGFKDVSKLRDDERLVSFSDQLFRALGSISANIAEGYSRSTGRDRARFFEYALGSARECRDWYFKCRYGLGNETAMTRIRFLTQIIRMLLSMIPHQRSKGLREETQEYDT